MARWYSKRELEKAIEAATTPLTRRIAELEGLIARLEAAIARLKKDSSTSSKPPSSDVVKPPKPKPPPGGKRGKRRGGGPPGHRRHLGTPFPADQVDQAWICEWTETPAGWNPLNRFRMVQQAELVKKPSQVIEHRARLYWNLRTGKIEAAPLSKEVTRGGLLGSRLTALVAYQKGVCDMSYRTIQRFFWDVLGLPISRGELVKRVMKVSTALGPSHEQRQRVLRHQASLGTDETSHREPKPKTSPGGSATTARPTSRCSTHRGSSRPTTARSGRSAFWPSTGRSPKGRAANEAGVGANGFGPCWRPGRSKTARPSGSSTRQS